MQSKPKKAKAPKAKVLVEDDEDDEVTGKVTPVVQTAAPVVSAQETPFDDDGEGGWEQQGRPSKKKGSKSSGSSAESGEQ